MIREVDYTKIGDHSIENVIETRKWAFAALADYGSLNLGDRIKYTNNLAEFVLTGKLRLHNEEKIDEPTHEVDKDIPPDMNNGKNRYKIYVDGNWYASCDTQENANFHTKGLIENNSNRHIIVYDCVKIWDSVEQ